MHSTHTTSTGSKNIPLGLVTLCYLRHTRHKFVGYFRVILFYRLPSSGRSSNSVNLIHRQPNRMIEAPDDDREVKILSNDHEFLHSCRRSAVRAWYFPHWNFPENNRDDRTKVSSHAVIERITPYEPVVMRVPLRRGSGGGSRELPNIRFDADSFSIAASANIRSTFVHTQTQTFQFGSYFRCPLNKRSILFQLQYGDSDNYRERYRPYPRPLTVTYTDLSTHISKCIWLSVHFNNDNNNKKAEQRAQKKNSAVQTSWNDRLEADIFLRFWIARRLCPKTLNVWARARVSLYMCFSYIWNDCISRNGQTDAIRYKKEIYQFAWLDWKIKPRTKK